MPSPIRRIPRTGSSASLPTREVLQRLATMEPGETLTYAEMKALTGMDMQERRDLLTTARRLAREIYRKEFDPINNVGLVCLGEAGKIGKGGQRRQRTHRFSGVTIDILATVDHAVLTPAQQLSWLGEMSVAAAVTLGTHEKTVLAIEAQARPQPLLIDPTAYKDVFKGL